MNLYRKITIENLELSDIKNIFVVYYQDNTHKNNKNRGNYIANVTFWRLIRYI